MPLVIIQPWLLLLGIRRTAFLEWQFQKVPHDFNFYCFFLSRQRKLSVRCYKFPKLYEKDDVKEKVAYALLRPHNPMLRFIFDIIGM